MDLKNDFMVNAEMVNAEMVKPVINGDINNAENIEVTKKYGYYLINNIIYNYGIFKADLNKLKNGSVKFINDMDLKIKLVSYNKYEMQNYIDEIYDIINYIKREYGKNGQLVILDLETLMNDLKLTINKLNDINLIEDYLKVMKNKD